MTTSHPQVKATAIVLAAGRSTRMGLRDGKRKPLFELAGRSVLARTLAALEACASVSSTVVVGRPEDLDALRAELEAHATKPVQVVPGGAERVDSARLGVLAAPEEAALVAVHDAARPLVEAEAVEGAIRAAAEHGAALLAMPCTDTVKETLDGETVERTLDRSMIWLAQTPQVFDRARFLPLFARARLDEFVPTDDASLWERYISPVRLVRGGRDNFKLTTPADLALAEAILRTRAKEECSR